MNSIYVLQLAEKSVCKYCGKHVELLCTEDVRRTMHYPMFYICFDCRKVFEVGVGEVRREEYK